MRCGVGWCLLLGRQGWDSVKRVEYVGVMCMRRLRVVFAVLGSCGCHLG